MLDPHVHLAGKADNPAGIKNDFRMMVSMGGNDKTVTSLVVRQPA
jgi:hypothetical protein